MVGELVTASAPSSMPPPPPALTGRLPNLLIAGVKKAGTTSLVDYLGQHPAVCPGDVKAVNWFREPAPRPPLEAYAAHWGHATGEAFRLEAPTTAFYGGRAMAEAIDATLPGVRVIVSLRDPVARLWSDFHMKRREEPARFGHVTFDEYVRRGQLAHRSHDLAAHPGYAAFGRGMYAEVVEAWFDVLDERFTVVFVEQWTHDPAGLLRGLCDWLGLDPGPVDSMVFPVRNPQRDFRSRGLARSARLGYRRMAAAVPAVARLKPVLVAAHDHVNAQDARDQRMSPTTAAYLRDAYAPANRALARLLRARGFETLPSWLQEPA